MKISFMTLGCPTWDLDTICTRGTEYGFDGVDFRGYLDEIDITKRPEFTTNAVQTRRQLDEAGLAVSGISTSLKVCDPDALKSNLEEARRTIGVARHFDAVNIRMFGGGDIEKYTHQELAQFGCDCVEQILDLEGARSLLWLFETHDNWVQAEHCKLLLDHIPDPAFGALWDMGHTWRAGREKPEDSFIAIGQRVGYTHVKDALYEPDSPLAMADGWHYVAPGAGELPLVESIELLKADSYDGWLLFEHEKRWHPNLSEPEEIFPQFVQWVRPLID
jgi:sugar phosphate isomerase/epimerase